MPNQLINATNPYLFQHTHNPVEWYPWPAVNHPTNFPSLMPKT